MAQAQHRRTTPPGSRAPEADSPAAVARLVRSAGRGDQRAWEALVDRYSGLVWAVARAHRLSAGDAADVSQTTWLQLVENLGRLRDPSRVGPWLATTARRECLRLKRGGERYQQCAELPESSLPDEPEIDAGLLVAERDIALWRAFGRLPDQYQGVLRLLTVDPPPSYQAIAAALDMPIGSIGPTRARALARLRSEAEALGLEHGAAG
jgi:RNA polymerase sigma factor (sigma-70 family)